MYRQPLSARNLPIICYCAIICFDQVFILFFI